MSFTKKVYTSITTGVVGAVSKVFSKGKLETFGSTEIKVSPNQLCRGIRRQELDIMLQTNQLSHPKDDKQPRVKQWDVEESDIGRQFMRGDPNLLSLTPYALTANLYGPNRYWLPRDGAIIVGCRPAVFTNIGEQARLCPPMCDKEDKFQQSYRQIQLLEGVNVADLVANSQEVAAVVGSQKGVSFDGMYPVDSFIERIYHVIGSGRSKFGLVPSVSCTVDEFINPEYVERALAVEIVLTKDPEHLEMLEDSMKRAGTLQPGQRVLTPDDAAVIMSDPELRALATAAAGPSGTITFSSVPKDVHGPEMISYVKQTLGEEIMEIAKEASGQKLKK